MKKLDMLVNELSFGDPVRLLADKMNIGLTEARIILSQMSFLDYRKLIEDNTSITPPSGNTIGPTANNQNNPSAAKATWTGKGPINVGMTVGLKGPNGVPMPGEVSQVDMSAKGVKVKNPTTGQDEWMNIDTIQPYMVATNSNTTSQNQSTGLQTQPTAEDISDLARLCELAGIKEDCSGGATGAGAIAIAPAAMGGIKKRQPTEEELKTEYTPKSSAKTIIGDTKPNQASGKLSADLAASGKKSAGRINNGRKQRT